MHPPVGPLVMSASVQMPFLLSSLRTFPFSLTLDMVGSRMDPSARWTRPDFQLRSVACFIGHYYGYSFVGRHPSYYPFPDGSFFGIYPFGVAPLLSPCPSLLRLPRHRRTQQYIDYQVLPVLSQATSRVARTRHGLVSALTTDMPLLPSSSPLPRLSSSLRPGLISIRTRRRESAAAGGP